MKGKQNTNTSTMVFGALLVIMGVLWILNNTEVIDFSIREWWPIILIFIGVFHLSKQHRVFDFFGGLMILLGVLFLLTENNFIYIHNMWRYWPIVLILLGLHIILERGSSPQAPPQTNSTINAGPSSSSQSNEESKQETCKHSSFVSDSDLLEHSCLMGAFESRHTSKNFKGGNVSVVLGGAEINLREAELAPEGAVLYLSAIFGGIDIRVPTHWDIEVHPSAVLGGVGAKCSNTQASSSKRLVIHAHATFGGIDIKN